MKQQLVFACDASHMVDEFQRAALVGLQGQAEALPLGLLLGNARRQRFEHLQREFQPVHFLGVDVQVDVGAGGLLAQRPDRGHQLGQHPFALRIFIPRVQRAQLDGDSVVLLGCALLLGIIRYEFNSIAVALEIV